MPAARRASRCRSSDWEPSVSTPLPQTTRTGQAGPQARRTAGRRPGQRRLREPVHAAARRHRHPRQLLTRRDIERLFGVGKVRAAALMKTFGAELVGNQRTLPRTKLLQQLKKHRGRAAFRVEEERRARLVAELQQARLTGVRFKVPAETMSAKLANLPEGVSVARGTAPRSRRGRPRPGRAGVR